MSQDELRGWIREFLFNPTIGWSRCERGAGLDTPGGACATGQYLLRHLESARLRAAIVHS
jgi:hypothetical protein